MPTNKVESRVTLLGTARWSKFENADIWLTNRVFASRSPTSEPQAPLAMFSKSELPIAAGKRDIVQRN